MLTDLELLLEFENDLYIGKSPMAVMTDYII